MMRGHGDTETRSGIQVRFTRSLLLRFILLCVIATFFSMQSASARELTLQDLISEALQKSPEIHAAQARAAASQFKIPQAKSLPDPMLMFGYQNEGYEKFNYGKSEDAQFMYSVSQMFPFPGKRGLKGEMVAREAESLAASSGSTKLKTIARIKELYYDLFFTYKSIDLLKDRTELFSQIENAALARYSSGMAPQQEVLMAQTEKYMLLEREEMLKQKIQALEAMLNTTVGRKVDAPLGRPVEPNYDPYPRSLDELIAVAYERSPDVKAKEKMVAAAEARIKMAKREYYPDITLAGSVFERKNFDDMWSVTTTVNVPIFYRSKQRQAVHEAEASLSEAQSELDATKLMLSSAIRDNYSMLKTTERLMDLYREGLIPKTYQDFESALAGYGTGKIEAITVINRLKAIIDFETSYWGQLAEREKAKARIEALTGIAEGIDETARQ